MLAPLNYTKLLVIRLVNDTKCGRNLKLRSNSLLSYLYLAWKIFWTWDYTGRTEEVIIFAFYFLKAECELFILLYSGFTNNL